MPSIDYVNGKVEEEKCGKGTRKSFPESLINHQQRIWKIIEEPSSEKPTQSEFTLQHSIQLFMLSIFKNICKELDNKSLKQISKTSIIECWKLWTQGNDGETHAKHRNMKFFDVFRNKFAKPETCHRSTLC